MSTKPEAPASPITVTFSARLDAVVVPEATGGYSASVPALPGCYTEGETLEEVQANLVEAAELWLRGEFDRRRGDTFPAQAAAAQAARQRLTEAGATPYRKANPRRKRGAGAS